MFYKAAFLLIENHNLTFPYLLHYEKQIRRKKELIAEFNGFAERANVVVRNMKPVDTNKVVLSSHPFASKGKTVSLTK